MFGVDEENGVIAINNVIGVMRGYFEAGCELGIVSWVFARSALYDPVKSGLCDVVERVEIGRASCRERV